MGWSSAIEDSHRTFLCARCRQLVRICTRCDRGNVYCAGSCADVRRREARRRANTRYQRTLRGGRNHAARQARYRERHRQEVTHPGSPPTRGLASLPPAGFEAVLASLSLPAKETVDVLVHPLYCAFCGACSPPFVRLGPLRRRRRH